VASYVDRAGLELVNGQPARSLAYTLASAEVVGLTPQTRLMAAHALDQLPPVRWWRDSKVMNAIFVPGSHDLVLSLENEIVRWSPDADQVRWRVPKSHPTAVMLVGRDAVVFAGDTSVALIAVADGASIAELKGAAGGHYNGRIGMDHSERWLAAGTADRTDLFDLTTRTLVASIPFADPNTLKVTADGEHIIATATPAAMSVLDRSGKVVATFEADSLHVVTAGDELVYAPPPGQNGIAHLVVGDWTGKARLDLPIGISVIQAIAVDVAAKRIAVGTADGVVQVRSLASGGASWQTSLGDRVGQLVFDGGVLRAASSSTVVGFDVTSGFEVERVSIPGDAVLAASDDHTRVAALAFGAGPAVWAPARGELVPVAPTAAALSDLAFAPDGTVITASADGEIHALRDGQSARRIASGGAINTFARLDDGTLIAASTDGMIVVRDRDGHELRRFKGGLEAAPSPDGRQIVTWAPDHTVVIWDLATGTSIRALGGMADVHSIRWSPDGRRIAAMATYGHVTVWDVKGSVIRDIPESALPPTNIAFSKDGKWLARSGEPAYMLFALDGGSDRKLLEAPQGAAAFVAFSPDDKTVLVAGADFVSTWDVATGAPRVRIATKGWVLSSAFLDNGRYIIAGGMDRHVHVWNADSGAELLAFTAPAMPRKIVAERNGARVAVLVPRNAMVWTVPTFPGTLEDLRESARCRLDLEVVDAHLRRHSIDIAACNHVPW
jgi:WD40 repeat protein